MFFHTKCPLTIINISADMEFLSMVTASPRVTQSSQVIDAGIHITGPGYIMVKDGASPLYRGSVH